MFVQTKVDILARIAGAASDEATRFYLCGVHVRKRARTQGAIVEATNGHILAVEHDGGADCSTDNPHSLIVRSETVKAIAAQAKKAAKAWRVAFADIVVRLEQANTGREGGPVSCYVLSCGEQSTPAITLACPDNVAFIDGGFPECERVVPHPKPHALPGTKAAYSARLLHQLAATAGSSERDAMAAKTAAHPFVLYSEDIGAPALMRVSGAPNWLGVIMPFRVDAESTAPRPAWFFAEPLRAAAE